MLPRSKEALAKFVSMPWTGVCLDLGCGDHEFVEALTSKERSVETLTRRMDDAKATHYGDFLKSTGQIGWMRPGGRPTFFETSTNKYSIEDSYDAVWCSHTLEHQLNPHEFLKKIRYIIREGGYLAIVVPTPRSILVAGHVHEYTPGLLILHLILAGFDCSKASVLCVQNEVSVVTPVITAVLPEPESRDGEYMLSQLDPYFPIRAYEGMPSIFSINWA